MDQRYVEAFMLGANYEMMSELLWRGYPTDQRGTVFTRFWGAAGKQGDVQAEYDKTRIIKDIHTWKDAGNTPTGLSLLGNNAPAILPNPDNLLILTVRGELLRRYPKTFVYANKAAWVGNDDLPFDGTNVPPKFGKERVLDETQGSKREPVFFTMIDDVAFFGFDIDKNEAKGVMNDPDKPGWYFIFKEVIGDTNFGLTDIGTQPNQVTNRYNNWNEADWVIVGDDFINPVLTVESNDNDERQNGIIWGGSASNLAYIIYRTPRIVAYHGHKLLESI